MCIIGRVLIQFKAKDRLDVTTLSLILIAHVSLSLDIEGSKLRVHATFRKGVHITAVLCMSLAVVVDH